MNVRHCPRVDPGFAVRVCQPFLEEMYVKTNEMGPLGRVDGLPSVDLSIDFLYKIYLITFISSC